MDHALGILELKSIVKGIETADVATKAGNVRLALAAPICPGKYIVIFSGDIGSVKAAFQAAQRNAGIFLVASHLMTSVHEEVIPALTATTYPDSIKSIGGIETMSAAASIWIGDHIRKAADIQLLEIRIARGLGGKGFVLFAGDIAAVNTAIRSAREKFGEEGEILADMSIATPSEEVIRSLL